MTVPFTVMLAFVVRLTPGLVRAMTGGVASRVKLAEAGLDTLPALSVAWNS